MAEIQPGTSPAYLLSVEDQPAPSPTSVGWLDLSSVMLHFDTLSGGADRRGGGAHRPAHREGLPVDLERTLVHRMYELGHTCVSSWFPTPATRWPTGSSSSSSRVLNEAAQEYGGTASRSIEGWPIERCSGDRKPQ